MSRANSETSDQPGCPSIAVCTRQCSCQRGSKPFAPVSAANSRDTHLRERSRISQSQNPHWKLEASSFDAKSSFEAVPSQPQPTLVGTRRLVVSVRFSHSSSCPSVASRRAPNLLSCVRGHLQDLLALCEKSSAPAVWHLLTNAAAIVNDGRCHFALCARLVTVIVVRVVPDAWSPGPRERKSASRKEHCYQRNQPCVSSLT